jgi:hypothetical protein
VTLNEEEVKIKEICRDFIKRWNVYKFDGWDKFNNYFDSLIQSTFNSED